MTSEHFHITYSPDKTGPSSGSTEVINGEVVHFNTPDQVLSALTLVLRQLESDGKNEITLSGSPIVFTVGLLQKLQDIYEEPFITEHLRKVHERNPGEDRPIRLQLASKIHTAFRPQGRITSHDARVAASHLLSLLENVPPRKEVGVELLKEEYQKLTHQDLDDAMDLVYFSLIGEVGSIGHQLVDSDFLESLIVSPLEGDPEERGFDIPKKLLDICKKLKDPDSAQVLESWIVSNIASDREGAIALIEALTKFTIFLDTESVLAIWNVKGSRINIQPFYSLDAGIRAAISYLRGVGVDEESPELKRLIDLREQVIINYSQVFPEARIGKPTKAGKFKNIDIKEAMKPNYRRLARRLSECCKSSDPEDLYRVASYATSVLKQTRTKPQDTREFIQSLYSYDPQIGKQILYRLVLEGIVTEDHSNGSFPTITDITKIRKECLESVKTDLLQHPFTDITDLNMADLINPETEFVYLYVVTGTFGPFAGHDTYMNQVFRYMDYQQSISTNPTGEQRFMLLLPVGRTIGTNYPKKFSDTGSKRQRLNTIMLGTAGRLLPRNRKRLLITTEAQPMFQSVSNVQDRVSATIMAISAQITADLRRTGRVAVNYPIFILTSATDELNWGKTKDGTPIILTKGQPPKVTGFPSLIISRQGDRAKFGGMVGAIESADRWKNALPKSHLVLAKRYPQSSSGDRLKLSVGDASDSPISLRRFLLLNYGEDAIKIRQQIEQKYLFGTPNQKESVKQLVEEEENLSVTEAYERLLDDIERLGLLNH